MPGTHNRQIPCGEAVAPELCAEIATPVPTECGAIVSGCDDGGTCIRATDPPGLGSRGFAGAQELCYRCGDFVWQPVWGLAEPIVCWPAKKVCHVVNFCAPDDYVGPPDMIGPGRFHPVPTHPVFAPAVVAVP